MATKLLTWPVTSEASCSIRLKTCMVAYIVVIRLFFISVLATRLIVVCHHCDALQGASATCKCVFYRRKENTVPTNLQLLEMLHQLTNIKLTPKSGKSKMNCRLNIPMICTCILKIRIYLKVCLNCFLILPKNLNSITSCMLSCYYDCRV